MYRPQTLPKDLRAALQLLRKIKLNYQFCLPPAVAHYWFRLSLSNWRGGGNQRKLVL